jgi:hypothetical protein
MLKITLKPNKNQQDKLTEYMNTSRYVYNKTIHCIETEKHPVNFMSLRTKLVTLETKTSNPDYISYAKSIKELKAQRIKDGSDICKLKITNDAIDELKSTRRLLQPSKTNLSIKHWELQTPKEIRSFAVADVVTSYKAAFTNLKNNTISFFKMKFKKKTNQTQCLCIPKTGIKNDSGCLHITPSFFKCKSDSMFDMGNGN